MTRIALGGIWHETNTFVPGRTSLEDFANYQFATGDQIFEQYAGTGTELGGVIEAAERAGVQVVPLAYAAAVPSGIVAADASGALLAEVTSRLRAAGPIDGVVLTLHGAMVAEDSSAPEAALTQAVRTIVGQAPIAVTLDLHANLTDQLCRAADVIVGYDTFPHVDMAERGMEAVGLVQRMLRGSRPRHAHVKLPLLTVPQMQATDENPTRDLVDYMHALERLPGVWTASLIPGYVYSDTDRLGYSVYVAADEDPGIIANTLAERVWSRREDFRPALREPREAVIEALRIRGEAPGGPVVLVDVADNVGGGSPGDGTVLLGRLLEEGLHDAVTVIWDPKAIQMVYSTTSSEIEITLGGSAGDILGPPLPVGGPVKRLGRVVYSRSGPYMTGQKVDMGRVARIRTDGGEVIVTELRVMPFDDDHIRACGVEPRECGVIVAKSAIAWRAAFGAYASRALFVRTPGFCPSDLSQLSFRRTGPAFPIQENVRWQPN